VAVKKGTTGHLWATKNLHKAKVLVLDKEGAAVLEVVQGKADAFIYDQMSVYSHWRRNETTTRAILAPFQQEAWAIGLPVGAAGVVGAGMFGVAAVGGALRGNEADSDPTDERPRPLRPASSSGPAR